MRRTTRECKLVPLGDNLEGSEKLLGIGLWPTMGLLTFCFFLSFLNVFIGFSLGALLLGGCWRLSQKNPRWYEQWKRSRHYYAVYDPGQPRTRWEGRLARWERRLLWSKK